MRSCYVSVRTFPWVTGADQVALHVEEKDSLSIKTISKQFANAKRSPDIVRYSCRKHRGREIFLYIRWTQDLLCNRRAPDLLSDLAAISVHNPKVYSKLVSNISLHNSKVYIILKFTVNW